jgi:hypothetical protein
MCWSIPSVFEFESISRFSESRFSLLFSTLDQPAASFLPVNDAFTGIVLADVFKTLLFKNNFLQ